MSFCASEELVARDPDSTADISNQAMQMDGGPNARCQGFARFVHRMRFGA